MFDSSRGLAEYFKSARIVISWYMLRTEMKKTGNRLTHKKPANNKIATANLRYLKTLVSELFNDPDMPIKLIRRRRHSYVWDLKIMPIHKAVLAYQRNRYNGGTEPLSVLRSYFDANSTGRAHMQSDGNDVWTREPFSQCNVAEADKAILMRHKRTTSAALHSMRLENNAIDGRQLRDYGRIHMNVPNDGDFYALLSSLKKYVREFLPTIKHFIEELAAAERVALQLQERDRLRREEEERITRERQEQRGRALPIDAALHVTREEWDGIGRGDSASLQSAFNKLLAAKKGQK